MKLPALVALALLSALLAALTTAWALAPEMAPVTGTPDAATQRQLDELRQRVDELTRRLEQQAIGGPVHGAVATTASSTREAVPSPPGRGSAPPASAAHDALWHLDRYVRSFDTDPEGSQFFRLAVEAYVDELVQPIAALVGDGSQRLPLRSSLVAMLSRRRFGELPGVLDAMLAALLPPTDAQLIGVALDALQNFENAAAVPGLAAAIPTIPAGRTRETAIAVLVQLAGPDGNRHLLQLFRICTDAATRAALVRQLTGEDAPAALELLSMASRDDVDVRLAAAIELVDHDEPSIDALRDEWITREGDQRVLAALHASRTASDQIASWSARKASGPPDADASRDDPNAWAPREPEMGRQWLQLTYAQPTRAHGVRVHEVNATGAVAEVLVRGADGDWATVWSGSADGRGAPLLLSFPLTPFPVRTIRLVLDTSRKSGWNEIDAVELLGPGGGQWAQSASASSSYAERARGRQPGVAEPMRLR
ncbi:MAG: HEAT repeat domain-containing protein [Planctomycetota bacterium]